MRRPVLPYLLLVVPLLILAALVANLVGSSPTPGPYGPPVAFGQVAQVLAQNCESCHPLLVPSLDLRPSQAYASIVGVRSIEDPTLMRVIAGDPEHSFLYLKIAGWPGNGANPLVGGRMPFGGGPLPPTTIDLIRRWILQGAKNASGVTAPATAVATPGDVSALAQEAAPQVTSGTATITGTVYDANHHRFANAFVTMLIVRKGLPFGEDHYLASETDATGRFVIRDAPVGRVAIKAYAAGTVYVERILNTAAHATSSVDIGLPREAGQNPTVSSATVTHLGDQLRLSMRVAGFSLDRNYTLALNPASGRVYELHSTPAGSQTPGIWSRVVPAAGTSGRWVFFAVSHFCSTSNILTVSPAA